YTPPPTPFYTLSLHDALPIYFHYNSRSRRLFDQIERGENLWIIVFDTVPPPGDWLLIERISVMEKRHNPEFARPYQIVGDPKKRSKEHTSELQSRGHLVCRLL